MAAFEPAYRELMRSDELKQRVSQAYERLEACDLCAWECGINRRVGEMGVCRSSAAFQLLPSVGSSATARMA